VRLCNLSMVSAAHFWGHGGGSVMARWMEWMVYWECIRLSNGSLFSLGIGL